MLGLGLGINKLLGSYPSSLTYSDYRLIAGVIRNTGSGWYLITTGGHTPLNIDSISNDTNYIYINFSSLGFTDLVSFSVKADEDFAGKYYGGAELNGTTGVKIRLANFKLDLLKATITHSGGGVFVSSNPAVVPTYAVGSGNLTLTHSSFSTTNNTPVFTNIATSASENTLFQNSSGSIAATTVITKLYNFGGTQKTLANPEISSFQFERKGEGIVQNFLDPNTVTSVTGNFWITGLVKI